MHETTNLLQVLIAQIEKLTGQVNDMLLNLRWQTEDVRIEHLPQLTQYLVVY